MSVWSVQRKVNFALVDCSGERVRVLKKMQSPCHAAEFIFLRGESYKKRGEPLTCLGIVGPKCHKTAQGSAETRSKRLVYKEFQEHSLDTFVCNCERTKTGGKALMPLLNVREERY
jgi:hypothetical protein